MVVAKVRERLAVSKHEAQKIDVERFSHLELNELDDVKQNQIKISSRFADLENLSYSEDIDRAWENIKENTKPQLKTV
jgi:hypothetical protein